MCEVFGQPPLGGCVLKHENILGDKCLFKPAAFRRLCVETPFTSKCVLYSHPAAFRRLCVETVVR